MSDQPPNGGPLFQGLDEQEQIYAPDQAPGALRPDADDGGLAEHIDDASGTPTVPAAPTTSITTPELTIAAPASIEESNRTARDDAQNSGQ